MAKGEIMPIRQTSKIFTIEGRVLASYCNQVPSGVESEMMWRWNNGLLECVALSITGDGTLGSQASVVMSERNEHSAHIAFDFLSHGVIWRIRESGKYVERHFIRDGYLSADGNISKEQIDELCDNGDLASEDDDAYNLRYEEK